MKEREKVLIVGGGGREHALGWKTNQSPSNPELFFAPGNAGTSQIGRNVDIDAADLERLLKFASDNKIGLTVVGPEAPLEKGIANIFREDHLRILAPTKEAAILETDKWEAIKFMLRHDIPHPGSKFFTDKQIQEALNFVEKPLWKEIVIKAIGLAGGKGVILPNSLDEAKDAINRILVKKEFDKGKGVIVQERLKGREVSLICITDGRTVVPLLPAQDYKRLKDNDKGPNTGGMGAIAPSPALTEELYKQIYNIIPLPTIRGMEEEGNPYQGVLYFGLMLTDKGPVVLEYNARFGDPETQVLMMLLKSDLLMALKNTTNGKLKKGDVVFRKGVSVCAVLAAERYPQNPVKGDVIYGLDKINNPNVQVFHAGTVFKKGQFETAGGRVLAVTVYGKDFPSAEKVLYGQIGERGINFRGAQFRTDIGWRDVQRLKNRF